MEQIGMALLTVLGVYIAWGGIEKIQFATKGYGMTARPNLNTRPLKRFLYKPEKATKGQRDSLWTHGVTELVFGIVALALGIYFLASII
jgi:hypothetical protein